MIPGESINKKALRLKILLPEYQSNDIENCHVLFPICSVMFSDLYGLVGHFFLSKWEIFCRKALTEKPAKTSENYK